jgi:hypothetical protein
MYGEICRNDYFKRDSVFLETDDQRLICEWGRAYVYQEEEEEERKGTFCIPSARSVSLFLHTEVRAGTAPIWPSSCRGLTVAVREKSEDERDEAIIFQHDQCCLKTLMGGH